MTGDMRSAGECFIDAAKYALAFLSEYGFVVTREELDPTPPRGEDIVICESPKLAIAFMRASCGGEVWGWFGRPNDESAILNGIGLWEVFERLGLPLPNDEDSIRRLNALVDTLRSGCMPLLKGDVSLLETIWRERRERNVALDARQRELAYRIETFADAEILELPNTKEALGEDFLYRFPNHDFMQDRIWLVEGVMGGLYCMNYESAREWVSSSDPDVGTEADRKR